MSAPAANARSEPVSTRQRTEPSASASSSASESSPSSWLFSAFSASGRFRRIRVTPALGLSTLRVWWDMEAPLSGGSDLRPRDRIAKRAQAGGQAAPAYQVADAHDHHGAAMAFQARVEGLHPG